MAATTLPGNWYVGQTWPILQIALNLDDIDPLTGKNKPDDITGVSDSGITTTIRDTRGNDALGTGTAHVLTNNPAVITYQFSSTDVATAGTIQLYFKLAFPGGVKVYDPITIPVAVD